MKTASIREVRHDFGRILEWVAAGEEVSITKRNETVARLLPVRRKKASPARMPDVAARLKKVFGRKVVSDKAASALVEESRGAY